MLKELFITFFKIGLFTFGGGYAMISQVREIVSVQKKWLTEDELIQVITVSESTPGPIAINMATYVGYKKGGVLGSAMATLGVVLPSLIIIYIISLFFDAFIANKYVAYAFTGIKCAVAFLILKAGLEMFKKMNKTTLSVITFLAVFCAMLAFEILSVSVSAILFIIIGGIAGIFAYGVIDGRKEANK